MCLGAFECLKCGRWLQPLLLMSNEARQGPASLWSSKGLWKCSKEPNKANRKGENHVAMGLQGICSSICLSVCSGSVPVQGRGGALCHLQCCLMQVDYLQVA